MNHPPTVPSPRVGWTCLGLLIGVLGCGERGDKGTPTETGSDAAAPASAAICAGGQPATDGTYSMVSCIAPMSAGAAATDGAYQLAPGPIVQIAPAAP